jgi:putative transcriptional regulator
LAFAPTAQANPSAKAKEPFFANAPILKLYLRLESFEQMNRIKEVLDEKGIKQTWLAEQLGKSYNMVNAYVQNRQQPRIEVLYDIAKILDVNVKDLLIDNDNKKNKK